MLSALTSCVRRDPSMDISPSQRNPGTIARGRTKDEADARAAFEYFDINIQYTRGHRYLGGFVGSAKTKSEWMKFIVDVWCEAVSTLSKVAVKYPQSAYVGFSYFLQNK
ncbi:hypothetical protein ACHAXR_006983 [Thalassiosira sp. AJA248-18]